MIYHCASMPRGQSTGTGRNSLVSGREKRRVGDGLMGRMPERERNRIRNNPNLHVDPSVARWEVLSVCSAHCLHGLRHAWVTAWVTA